MDMYQHILKSSEHLLSQNGSITKKKKKYRGNRKLQRLRRKNRTNGMCNQANEIVMLIKKANKSMYPNIQQMVKPIDGSFLVNTNYPNEYHNSEENLKVDSTNDIDHICTNPSPIVALQSCLLPSDILFDSNIYEPIVSNVCQEKMINIKQEEREEDEIIVLEYNNDNQNDNDQDYSMYEEQFDEMTLYNKREQEMQDLLEISRDTQSMDDNTVNSIVHKSNGRLHTKTIENNNNQPSNELQTLPSSSSSSVIVTTYPDPPMNQTGRIAHHDHSYTKYGDLD
ncbi:unnamed protein product [Rotaria sordida]|uniref:Uncharacterized protein n=1 Tax=Rotaria sordida TaxID=392033 RepID=A0A815RE85_9BILA|nr:unnamed protein product [Rotaria sordida]CAF4090747.1 unnamed protein product [Rotaria sordida]